MNTITINWHIIETCNYSCTFCFAKYKNSHLNELHKTEKHIDILLGKVYDYFKKEYDHVRLNIAGGEPTLSKNLNYIIHKANRLGFEVSIITNGSKLTDDFIERSAKYISMFAISVDSINAYTNEKIGRISKEKTMEASELLSQIKNVRQINPNVKIKINTVVNKHNYHENLAVFIRKVDPYKWKVFQALSVNTNEIFCSDDEYMEFVQKHEKSIVSMSKESGDDMRESYIMIDPYGRFYQNSGQSYDYSETLMSASVSNAFNSIAFDRSKFDARYA